MNKKRNSIHPLADKVLVSKEVSEITDTGFILPISASEKGTSIGKVIAVGEGRRMDDGKLQPMSVKPGEKILYSWGDKVELDDMEYQIVGEASILAVIR